MSAPATDNAKLPLLPPVIFALCVLASIGVRALFPYPLTPPVPFRVAGLVLVLGAAVLSGWASATLRLGGTTVRPDRPTTALVTDGPYRFTRNPLYLALCLLHAGGALLIAELQPLLMTAVLAMALYRFAILPEERYLETKFGARYDDYRRRVGRWF